jgi:2-oxoglutarate dehydrogenase E1 component
LAQGSFQELLDDPSKPEPIRQLVFCSGRLYYDLIAARNKANIDDVAIIRIEQLYPFPKERIAELIRQYKGFKECVWIQEEPVNMGACDYVAPMLESLLPEKIAFRFIARPRSASPAVGAHALHDQESHALITALLGERHPSIFDLAVKKS